MPANQPAVEKLIHLLQTNVELKAALIDSIKKANEKDIETLPQFYNFLNGMLTLVPTDKQFNAATETFWVILNKDHTLKKSEPFNEWVTIFIKAIGSYMDSTESVKAIETFFQNPNIKMEEYITPPGGWLTYNQFLARHVKPFKRPVDERCDDNVIVSPADSKYLGEWEIEKDSTITVKGNTYYLSDLLAGSKYWKKFSAGIFTHSHLSVQDYHRYHAPVSGKIVEMKKIAARTWTNEIKNFTGKKAIDDVGFQFNQTRGYIILKTNTIGFVALIPVGMGFVSSVNFTADEGAKLTKGDEFGFFAYGGSDMIMLFETGHIKLTAIKNRHYLQGEKIAKAIM